MSNALRRVMIVDDHEALLRGVRGLLESRPNYHIVAEALDGQEALEAARATQPDIAVIDYMLPEMNGLELTRALKQEFPRIEILLYTMYEREGPILEVLRAGARGCVFKSDSEKHLLAALDALAIHRPYFSSVLSGRLLEHFVDASATRQATLTGREREVVRLIADGKINKQIGGILEISSKTVESHRASAMHKLKLRTTAQLVRYALRNDIAQL